MTVARPDQVAEAPRPVKLTLNLRGRLRLAVRGLRYGWRGYDVTTAEFPPMGHASMSTTREVYGGE